MAQSLLTGNIRIGHILIILSDCQSNKLPEFHY